MPAGIDVVARGLAASALPQATVSTPTNAAKTLRQVTSRVAICSTLSGGNTQSGWRAWQMAYVDITQLRIYFGAFYVPSGGSETSLGGGTMTYRVAVEWPIGTILTGNYSVTVNDLAIGYVDVPLGTTIPAFSVFRINGDLNGAGGAHVPSISWSDTCDRGNGDQYQAGASGYGHTLDTTVLGPAAGVVNMFLPQAILAMSNKNVWCGLGDSQMAGTNDQGHDPNGGRGLYGRAMAALGPHLNYGCPGDRANLYVGSHALRLSLMQAAGIQPGSGSVLLQLGINDFFTGSRTADQVLADRATIRSYFPGVSVYDTTTGPQTTSSDGFATTTNQATVSATNNASRCAFNDFLRGCTTVTTTGTLTNSSTSLTAIGSMWAQGIAVGMTVTSTTSGIPGSTTVSAVNFSTSTVTLSAAFTGTTTPGASVTFAWPASGQTFPTTSAGLVDPYRLVEGAPSINNVPRQNGGVLIGGFTDDGLHTNALCNIQTQQVVTNQVAGKR